uniref:Uncharacterized protein LOC104250185 n=1 Tax=Nicotiana sylvestris TaxID=4096 RepID=A0A1U7YLW8_NICSY|nr:PREDICTED: uncharacterized protein LOC104250185 [Nicotiana sylvestris]
MASQAMDGLNSSSSALKQFEVSRSDLSGVHSYPLRFEGWLLAVLPLTPTVDRNRTVSRRSKPNSCTT